MFFVYVIKSVEKKFQYIGHTENIQKRIKEHNTGKTKSTKFYKPFELIYLEVFKTRNEAIIREKYLKSGIGREFLKEKLKNALVVQLDRIPDFGSGG